MAKVIDFPSEDMEVVKVQIPLFGTENWLIYAPGRKRMCEIHPNKIPKKIQKMMEGKLKEFFFASWETLPTPHWELSEFLACEEDFK